MRIIYCIAKTCASGGMERVLSIKANYLVGKGYDVNIITTDQRRKDSFFSLDPRIKCYDLGINYEDNNGKSFFNKLSEYPFKKRAHKRRLNELLVELKADIVISMFCNDASFITDIRDGSKKILEIHFSKLKRLQYGRTGIWGLTDRFLTKVDERIVRKFDRFVVLTEEDCSYWGKLPNIEVIANPLSYESKRVSSLASQRVLAVGRFDYQKGFDRLIEAWVHVHRIHPGWQLDIVGEGLLEENLRVQIERLHLSDSIALLPPTNEIEDYYMKASFLVMSSRYEGLPMVLLEAQSFGLPLVSFACKCGPSDIITDGVNGYLVPDGDIESLALRIIDLIGNMDQRFLMGRSGKVSSTRFTQEVIMQKWMNLFDVITNRKEIIQ